VTVIAFPVPVVVPVSTNLAPSDAVMMLALTPGFFDAPLMAAAIPASVSSVESMLIGTDAPPTAIVKVPVPIVVPELATGAEVSVAAVARFCTAKVYVPATAPVPALADAMVVSPTVPVNPARPLAFSKGARVLCSVSSALVNVPNADTWESRAVPCVVN
jgi:hypothetical protein